MSSKITELTAGVSINPENITTVEEFYSSHRDTIVAALNPIFPNLNHWSDIEKANFTFRYYDPFNSLDTHFKVKEYFKHIVITAIPMAVRVAQTPTDPDTPIVKPKVDLSTITNGDTPGTWTVKVNSFEDLATEQENIINDILTAINQKTDRNVGIDDLDVITDDGYQMTITPSEKEITKVSGSMVVDVSEIVNQTPIDPDTPIVKPKVDLSTITNGEVPGVWNIELDSFADLETLQDSIITDILTAINSKTEMTIVADDLNVVVDDGYQMTVTPAPDRPIEKLEGVLSVNITESILPVDLATITNVDEPGVWRVEVADESAVSTEYDAIVDSILVAINAGTEHTVTLADLELTTGPANVTTITPATTDGDAKVINSMTLTIDVAEAPVPVTPEGFLFQVTSPDSAKSDERFEVNLVNPTTGWEIKDENLEVIASETVTTPDAEVTVDTPELVTVQLKDLRNTTRTFAVQATADSVTLESTQQAARDVDVVSFNESIKHYAFNLPKVNLTVPNELPAYITDTSDMFNGSKLFNQDISGWDVSNVTKMDGMFKGIEEFNVDLSTWDVTNIPEEPLDFSTGTPGWVLPKPNWKVTEEDTPVEDVPVEDAPVEWSLVSWDADMTDETAIVDRDRYSLTTTTDTRITAPAPEFDMQTFTGALTTAYYTLQQGDEIRIKYQIPLNTISALFAGLGKDITVFGETDDLFYPYSLFTGDMSKTSPMTIVIGRSEDEFTIGEFDISTMLPTNTTDYTYNPVEGEFTYIDYKYHGDQIEINVNGVRKFTLDDTNRTITYAVGEQMSDSEIGGLAWFEHSRITAETPELTMPDSIKEIVPDITPIEDLPVATFNVTLDGEEAVTPVSVLFDIPELTGWELRNSLGETVEIPEANVKSSGYPKGGVEVPSKSISIELDLTGVLVADEVYSLHSRAFYMKFNNLGTVASTDTFHLLSLPEGLLGGQVRMNDRPVTVPSTIPESMISLKGFFEGSNLFNQDISGWDTTNIESMDKMLRGATAFNQPLNTWNTSKVTSMETMFSNATSFNGDISSWDVSSVTNMRGIFNRATSFNSDISAWNVSSVTNMGYMFAITDFNQDISMWDVSSVTTMNGMFEGNTAFNSDISSWDVSNVTNMYSMFGNAIVFNQDISGWDVSNVTDMTAMFSGSKAFNNDLSSWCVSQITAKPQMFNGNSILTEENLPVWGTCPRGEDGSVPVTPEEPSTPMGLRADYPGTGWYKATDTGTVFNKGVPDGETHVFDDSPIEYVSVYTIEDAKAYGERAATSNLTMMNGMFEGAVSFNQDLSSWDVSNVTDMRAMFYEATSFNSDISNWNVSNATNMSNMFYMAASFNQDLSGWCVSLIATKPNDFHTSATAYTLPKPVWGTCPRGEDGSVSEPVVNSKVNLSLITNNDSPGNWTALLDDLSTFESEVPAILEEVLVAINAESEEVIVMEDLATITGSDKTIHITPALDRPVDKVEGSLTVIAQEHTPV